MLKALKAPEHPVLALNGTPRHIGTTEF